MKTLKTLALLGALAAISSVMAGPITGTINFSSSHDINLNNSDFQLVTEVDFPPNTSLPAHVGPNAIVTSGSDSFSVFATGTPVTFNDFIIGIAEIPLWTIAGGWSFDLLTSANTSLDNNTFRVTGSGTLHAPGYEDTTGNFIFSANRSTPDQVRFSFSGTSTAVPDGGATALILGLGVLGLGALRRKS